MSHTWGKPKITASEQRFGAHFRADPRKHFGQAVPLFGRAEVTTHMASFVHGNDSKTSAASA
jgi:hypothetical protein